MKIVEVLDLYTKITNVLQVILNALKKLYLQYLQGNHNLSQENKRNILGWSFPIHIKRFFITKENLNGTCLYMAIDPTNIRKLKKVGIDGYFDLKEHN